LFPFSGSSSRNNSRRCGSTYMHVCTSSCMCCGRVRPLPSLLLCAMSWGSVVWLRWGPFLYQQWASYSYGIVGRHRLSKYVGFSCRKRGRILDRLTDRVWLT
jgi:hypothetical protein